MPIATDEDQIKQALKRRRLQRKTWIWLSLPLGLILWVSYSSIEESRRAARWRENAGREILLSDIRDLSDSNRHPEGYPGDEHRKAVDTGDASDVPFGASNLIESPKRRLDAHRAEGGDLCLCVYTAGSLNSFLGSTEQITPYELLRVLWASWPV